LQESLKPARELSPLPGHLLTCYHPLSTKKATKTVCSDALRARGLRGPCYLPRPLEANLRGNNLLDQIFLLFYSYSLLKNACQEKSTSSRVVSLFFNLFYLGTIVATRVFTWHQTSILPPMLPISIEMFQPIISNRIAIFNKYHKIHESLKGRGANSMSHPIGLLICLIKVYLQYIG
jgi:hypothetical protein